METLYPSTRAFIAVVKDGVAVGEKIVQITENSVLLVSANGLTTASIVAQLNLSDYVRVTASGANLPENNAGEAFAGGNNGSAVTATEYSAFLTEIEADGTANSFALDGVTDEAILTVAETWVNRVRDEGVYITWVRGGPIGWDTTIASANAKSKALNYRGIINVGNGCGGYTAADMAIFIAARAASVALNATLTDEVTTYTEVNKKLTPSQRITAKQSGTLIFVKEGGAVVIDEGVNTLTVPHANETVEMGKIRINNALDSIAKDLETFGNAYKRDRSNTQEARVTYAATVQESYLKPLVAMEVLQPGAFYEPDPEYHGLGAVFTPKIDEAFFHADLTPVDSMERIYQKLNVNF
jgi:hypothetical protein